MDQDDKGKLFRELHVPGDPLVLPNAYDVGSARMLVGLGAKAIATTSSGFAATIGLPDFGHVSRDQMLDHCEDIVRSVNVPVTGDLENGYADDPEGVAETVRLAAEVGLVGCALEDVVPDADVPYYNFDIAVARMAAAVEAAEALPFDFTICARADGVMLGAYGVEEAIRRVQAFEEVGAHCVYAPMLPTMDDLATLCASVSVPVNALCAGGFTKYSRDDFAKIGVARISVGGSLARATHKVVADIGTAMLSRGDFSALGNILPGKELEKLMKLGEA